MENEQIVKELQKMSMSLEKIANMLFSMQGTTHQGLMAIANVIRNKQ